MDDIGPNTAARLIAEFDDPARFKRATALAADVGVVPATSQTGRRGRRHVPLAPTGNGRLRMALWMPTLAAVMAPAAPRPLVAAGKLRKVATGRAGSDNFCRLDPCSPELPWQGQPAAATYRPRPNGI